MKFRRYIPEFILLVYAVLFLLTKNPNSQWDRVIVSDGKGYYAYLTALFIYHDTDFGFIDNYESKYYPASKDLYKDFRYNTGHGIVNKYFPGPAILWLPFFGAGHAVALLFGYAADGYSLPYQMAIAAAAFFYFWLSLLILRKILRFYTNNENTIAWSLVATALATNLIYHTVNAGCQVHVYNFFLINAFIYSALLANKKGETVHFASAAFMLGMILISRPQNGLVVFALPFVCGSRESLLRFLKRVFTRPQILFPSALALILPLLVPVTYWYAKTGHFLVYSYGSESYNLAKPHLLSFLFSFEKGWLLYTPIAAFAALGFISLFRKSKFQFFSLSFFLFFIVYFMSSWWVWTYTSYVSQRVMIDYYAFISILLVFTFKLVKKNSKTILVPIALIGFIALNLMQHFQHIIWVYPAGPVTAKTYFSNFFSFNKGTTFMIPSEEVLNKQSYKTDFENKIPFFITGNFTFTKTGYSGEKALVLDTVSRDQTLFVRGMPDYKETHPVILKIGGWYNPQSTDSSLSITVTVGNSREIYSATHHNLMPGLKKGKWKYAEMAVYLPYFRSVSDSIFVSFRNASRGKVLLDDFQVDLLKMQNPFHHDWILPADDPADTATLYHTDLEIQPVTPWGNTSTIVSEHAYSGKKSCRINAESPYSVVFEKELDTAQYTDGYFRVSSRTAADADCQVFLVFDFTSKGKQVLYKTYPVQMSKTPTSWLLSEMFCEFPVSRLNADKVKIYYWYTAGPKPVYLDNFEVDIVRYKTAVLTLQPDFKENSNAATLKTTCCDFETICMPPSGTSIESAYSYSGKKVCIINKLQPFSFSHLLPLNTMASNTDAFVYINARVNSDHHFTKATLVADFRHNGKTVSYNPAYLKGQTIKGKWNAIDFGVKVPKGITANDSVLVYFYLPPGEEEMMIDDFCVSLKKRKKSE